ncbi:ABC transporter substrate-binding protein [Planococcus lenghuensis]|uniref:ABC transporter substrate-binding protein n=1 Tax=Planococcus lenghuensis TaxID=2213202 RepID=A0A1Q2L271_9BACL|nr:ABC transporter substrate-binding protein [Planococcus lenghuensis]AQQ53982.1 ABC transporter substrate-binding protein [Planococcus lenghuensis]
MLKNKWMLTGMASLTLALGACGAEEAGPAEEGAAESEEAEVLEMATSADYPPYESRNAEGEFVGFDIELAEYIADELGRELEITDMKFDGLVGALQAGRVDMVLAGMNATEERKENVEFSTVYHNSGETFLTLPDAGISSIEDLEGRTVAVQLGTMQQNTIEALVEEEGMDIEIKAIDDAGLMIQELMSGRVDAAYLDTTAATGFIEEQGLAGFEDPTVESPGVAIAFPKDSELVDDVNEILAEAEESGYLEELRNEWLVE